jgi:hypothetical protein
MSTNHVPGKPRVGTFVDYYNPKLMQRIGFTEGYGKRYEGPYAALVTNDIGHGLTLTVFMPGVSPIELADVPHQAHQPAVRTLDGTNHPFQAGNGYWDWQSPLQAARAAKEVKDADPA